MSIINKKATVLVSALLITLSASSSNANDFNTRDFFFFQNLDRILAKQLRFHNVRSVEPPSQQDPDLVELGRNLVHKERLALVHLDAVCEPTTRQAVLLMLQEMELRQNFNFFPEMPLACGIEAFLNGQ